MKIYKRNSKMILMKNFLMMEKMNSMMSSKTSLKIVSKKTWMMKRKTKTILLLELSTQNNQRLQSLFKKTAIPKHRKIKESPREIESDLERDYKVQRVLI